MAQIGIGIGVWAGTAYAIANGGDSGIVIAAAVATVALAWAAGIIG